MQNLTAILKNVSSWNDIYSQFKKYNVENNRSAGRLFEQFCKYYYLCEPSIKNEYKNVWLFDETPSEVKTKLNLGKVDHGIDLVLEGQGGDFSVVQCKFRNDQSCKISWTKDSLANLFADGDKADYFIVFTNASGLDKHSLTKKENQLKLVTIGDLTNIAESTIGDMARVGAGHTRPPAKIKEPRDYQKNAIESVLKGFEKQNRGQLILPCGAGKTLVSLWIKEALKPKHTLVLVPSLALLRQIKNEWAVNTNRFIPYICVCSEKDINKDKDSTVVHAYEIGGRVSTNSDEIKSFLNSHNETIVFSTYQSLESICDAVKNIDFKFDLAICDEAHKTSGSKIGKFGLIHSDSNIRVDKRLYMTATPRVMSDSLKNELNNDVIDYVCDMDNPDIYGSEFYRMSFKEAIEKEILVDYQIVAIGIDDQELEEAIKQRRFTADDESIDEIANNYALEKFMQKHNTTHAITFHSSVRKAKAFQERHQSIYPELLTYHVNGEQSTNDRNVKMKEFANSSKAIITNARCLTEGVDVPAIDVVYFCDPKNSKIDIVQATGRALRRADHKGKKFGYVVVPIFHRAKENVEEMIETGAFKNLMGVVRALCSQDERIVDEIKEIKIGKGERKSALQHASINYSCDLITIDGFHDELRKNLFDQVVKKIIVPPRCFEKAKEFARSLNFKSRADWSTLSLSGGRPDDIPGCPDQTYKNKGWISWGDFLGTGNIAPFNRIYKSFQEAKEYVCNLQLKNLDEWKEYCKSGNKPADIPTNANSVYKELGWISWGDFLGTGNIAPFNRVYRPFSEAREFARSLKLKKGSDWMLYAKSGKKPADIPAIPHQTYRNQGWISVSDWLGTKFIANKNKIFMSFEEARDFVHTLSLKSQIEWFEYVKSPQKPNDIPANASVFYKNRGWISWGDWLGTYEIASYNKIYRSFYDARKFARSLGLNGQNDWIEYHKSGKRPLDIPASPSVVYKHKGWVSWHDWVGKEFLSFNDAREFVQKLNLKSSTDWINYVKTGKKPENIPSTPQKVYKNKGWISFGDWLGTNTVSVNKRNFREFNDARNFVHELFFKNIDAWKKYTKSGEKPNDIPVSPNLTYKNSGWVSWSDWLGKEEK